MAINQKKIQIPDDTYEWLMQVLRPKDLSCNASLGEFVRNETLRDIAKIIQHKKERP